MFLFADDENDYSDNMNEQVDMVEVKTELNESEELFSVCKNTNMLDNHLTKDKVTSKSKNHSFI